MSWKRSLLLCTVASLGCDNPSPSTTHPDPSEASTAQPGGGAECDLPSPDSQWGAQALSSKNLTSKAWEEMFEGSTTTELKGKTTADDLQQVIDACTGPCVISIKGSLVLEKIVWINKSSVKIVGAVDNDNYANKVTIEHTATNSECPGVPQDTGFWIAEDVGQVIIDGLNIDGAGKQTERTCSKGDCGCDFNVILVDGNEHSKDIIIRNNRIANFDHGGENIQPILVNGKGQTEGSSVENVIIEENELSSLRIGEGEAISVNGNVRRWRISNNTIEDLDNIAIDAIGGEGTSCSEKDGGPSRFDAAREGTISGNTVRDLVQPPCKPKAAAIYVDGGRDIEVRDNAVFNVRSGYEIGAERPGTASNITLENNVAEGTQALRNAEEPCGFATPRQYADLAIGGYEAGRCSKRVLCEADPVCGGLGSVTNVSINQPTFRTVVGHRVRRSIVVASDVGAQNPDVKVCGDDNSIRVKFPG